MSGGSPGRRLRRTLLPLLAFTMVAGLLSGGPAAAHTFTKSDGNDSKGRLDLRSVTVSHSPTGAIVYRFVTFERWTAKSLGPDSFFLIQIDKDHKDEPIGQRYERCAFIFFGGGKLRGSLSNCGRGFIQGLKVSKPSGTAAKITIPKGIVAPAYWWAAASVWVGPRPCANACLDFAPNDFPDILHDLERPTISMDTTDLRIWEAPDGTDNTFDFSFTVNDGTDRSGMKSWKVERSPIGGATWTEKDSGTGGGTKIRAITDTAGQYTYRVTAIDNQGNKRTRSRKVLVPFDDDEVEVSGGFSGIPPVSIPDLTAFGGSYSTITSATTFTYTTDPLICPFVLIGPGGGTWNITVSVDGVAQSPIDSTDFPSGVRLDIFSDESCGATYVVTVNSGVFGLDAVLG